MHNDTDILSSVIKSARENADITIEALAAKIDISERYIYRIENEQKKPSFNVLLKLIRELAINSDLIFYPDKPCKDTEVEDLIRMLYNCDERSMEIIRATVKAALESQSKE
ncbi:MAG: helix-turn-helix transcriptional regulator [Oscillospiraceae bacterium]